MRKDIARHYVFRLDLSMNDSGFASLIKTLQLTCVLAESIIQKFDGDFAVEFRILSQKHLTHPTRADLRNDFVMGKSFADYNHFLGSAAL